MDQSRNEGSEQSWIWPATVVGQTVTIQRPKETAGCENAQNETKWLVDLCKENRPEEEEGSWQEEAEQPPESREKVEMEVRAGRPGRQLR